MRRLRVVGNAICFCAMAVQIVTAANTMTSLDLRSPEEGEVVAAAFSSDSRYLALLRNIKDPAVSRRKDFLQILDLKLQREVIHSQDLDPEPADLAAASHMLEYSADGRYLLLAANGGNVISVIDAATLHILNVIALHPNSRRLLGEEHQYFNGVISLSSSMGDSFAVLAHDELQGNEMLVGSFSTRKILNTWGLGKGRTATQLGETSLAMSDDGSKIAVSMLPSEGSLPKGFNNLRLYDSGSGRMLSSVRTDGLIGKILLLSPDNVLGARIDTPGLFSKKECIENWSFSTQALRNRYCDKGRNVTVSLDVSVNAHRAVGFATQLHKSMEGQVYAASGRVDVWDLESGKIIASSEDIHRLISSMKISLNGEWIVAGQMLFQVNAGP